MICEMSVLCVFWPWSNLWLCSHPKLECFHKFGSSTALFLSRPYSKPDSITFLLRFLPNLLCTYYFSFQIYKREKGVEKFQSWYQKQARVSNWTRSNRRGSLRRKSCEGRNLHLLFQGHGHWSGLVRCSVLCPLSDFYCWS